MTMTIAVAISIQRNASLTHISVTFAACNHDTVR